MKEKKKIAIYGLGFVGLPLALSFALSGAEVIGIDVDEMLITELKQGKTHHLEFYKEQAITEILVEQLAKGNFIPTMHSEDAVACSVYIITVGIPVSGGIINSSYLESACFSVAKNLKLGDLVLLRSTVVPGTTVDFVLPLLETISGLKAGEEFYLAYASERIAEGKAFHEFESMPTVVGGITLESAEVAEEILKIITRAEIHKATNIKVVETAKVMENISRDVNIAMANEFALFAKAAGVNIFEVINMANTHSRVNILTPGPGVGGYCIPNALYYLLPEANKYDVNLNLLTTARMVNDNIPHRIVRIAHDKLQDVGKTLRGSRIAVLGLAMKDFSNDDRISPAVQIVELLINEGAEVKAFDPAVPTRRTYKVDSMEECIEGADMLLILTRQKEFKVDLKSIYDKLASPALIFDTRNMLDKQAAAIFDMDVVGL